MANLANVSCECSNGMTTAPTPTQAIVEDEEEGGRGKVEGEGDEEQWQRQLDSVQRPSYNGYTLI